MAWINSKNNPKNSSQNLVTNLSQISANNRPQNIRRRWLYAPAFVAACAVAGLGVSACASWDEPSAHQNLKKDVVDNGIAADPRSFQGGTIVSDLDEVVPVTNSPAPQLPVSVTDADGYDVVVEDVSRILAIDFYGTFTKTVRGLGLADNLVGRTVASQEKSLADLPVVTHGAHALNAEAILELNPSVLVINHSIGPSEVIDQVRAAGVTTVVLEEDRSLETMGAQIRRMGEVLGVADEGEALAQRSEEELDDAKAAIAQIAPKDPLRMAFLYGRGESGVFYILGRDSGTDDLIEGIGGIDAATANGIGSQSPASPEALAELNPEVYIMMSGSLRSIGDIEGLLDRPGVAHTIAGQKQRVIALPDGQALAFGPQSGQLLLATAKAIYHDE
ncbi:heme/hemin ABC transporter substrate-binding protein [Corynebacterium propinquum]|uniref:heme/hemin ABC transporter substrate-binding protein n=1 Tax=Corynebacterium propinquum TaxID=43769 RepID=UPI002670B128|nr:ABC transporter substrate-binding protein [Corynebacterium propinquum]WKS42824.1 ABC transporter substrate-binding protein [Corynebacterium propinquum]